MKTKIKEKIKKIVLPIFFSVISGSICGGLVYSIYAEQTEIAFNGNLVYLIQSGAYSSYDSMRASTTSNDYVYYEDDGLYKAIIGITKNADNIKKIQDSYGGDTIVTSYYINDEDIVKEIEEYDLKLNEASTQEEIQTITLEMIKIYKQE